MVKTLVKRVMGRFWRFATPIRRPLVRRVEQMLDARAARLESTFDAKFPDIAAEVNLLFRSLLIELDHIERRLDTIQAMLEERR